MSALLPNLLHFSRLLGALGLDVQAVRTLDCVQALDQIDIGRRTDFYHTLRCLLVHRPRDIPIFDDAFRVFWRRPPTEWTDRDLRALGEQRKTGRPRVEAPLSGDEPRGAARQTPPLAVDQAARMSYSDREVLRTKDFARLTEAEVADAQRMMAELRWDMDVRRTRRWQSGRGAVFDLRRAMQANIRYGFEWLEVPTRRRKTRPRPLVLICDVSGSMERYSRMLLHFVSCLAGRMHRVEAFVFATRLTRVTRRLERGPVGRPAAEAIAKVASKVPDFAGGTRIGQILGTFNRHWARRILGRGSVVLMISDGWDRGSPEQLGEEMARLHRTARRVIWLNPLLGSPDYVPLTRGMQAALPHIDDFLPVHDLDSLEALGKHLNRLSEPRWRVTRVPRISSRRVAVSSRP